MPRPLTEIIAHIRAVAANPAVSTTLIQTDDLLLLCDAAENGRLPDATVLYCDDCGAYVWHSRGSCIRCTSGET